MRFGYCELIMLAGGNRLRIASFKNARLLLRTGGVGTVEGVGFDGAGFAADIGLCPGSAVISHDDESLVVRCDRAKPRSGGATFSNIEFHFNVNLPIEIPKTGLVT